jgi:hypothetical protein
MDMAEARAKNTPVIKKDMNSLKYVCLIVPTFSNVRIIGRPIDEVDGHLFISPRLLSHK